VVAPQILKSEVWEAMQQLEETLTELPGVDSETVAAIAERAGNSSEGRPPRPRANDPIGTSRYTVEFLRTIAEVLIEQERRISELEARS
jgi:hypothetical protein